MKIIKWDWDAFLADEVHWLQEYSLRLEKSALVMGRQSGKTNISLEQVALFVDDLRRIQERTDELIGNVSFM